jgi:hypothetical protein
MFKNYHATPHAVSRIDATIILSVIGDSVKSQPVVRLSIAASKMSLIDAQTHLVCRRTFI